MVGWALYAPTWGHKSTHPSVPTAKRGWTDSRSAVNAEFCPSRRGETCRPAGVVVTRYAVRRGTRTAALALLCLGVLAPALARASEPTWLVGTSTGVSAARAVPGERIAPGIRVVRGGASAARRLKRLPGVRFVEPQPPLQGEQHDRLRATRSSAASGRSARRGCARRGRPRSATGCWLPCSTRASTSRTPTSQPTCGRTRARSRATPSTTTATASSTTFTAPTPSAGTATRATASGTARPWRASSRRAATTASASAAWRGTLA